MLRRILAAQLANPITTVMVALALSALSIVYTVGNLAFETSQKDLISPRDRLVQLLDELEPFEDVDSFVVAIEHKRHTRALEFLHALVPHLERDKEHFIDVFYRVAPDLMKPWLLFYLDEEDLISIHDSLLEHKDFIRNLGKSPSLNRFFFELNREMSTKMVDELFTGFLDEPSADTEEEPLDLGFLISALVEMQGWIDGKTTFSSPWGSFFAGASWVGDEEEGYFWVGDKRYLLAFVTPAMIDASFTDTQDALKALRRTIVQVKKEGFDDVEVGVTGEAALGEDEMDVAFHDMSLATLVSLMLLTLLLVLFWRGFLRPILEIIELVVALSLTFGLTTAVVGHLNILSVTFAPLLLGLGIDYGIHWFARYQEEERVRTGSRKEAIEATMMRLGPGILLAGFTAALSFFPLVLTGFKGLVELGIICSMGMVMTTVSTLCLLPSLTLLFDKPKKRAKSRSSQGQTAYFLKLTGRRALVILIPASIALGLSVWGAGRVTFDLNMLRLQSKGAESVIWERKLMDGSEHSSLFGALLARSIEEVRQKTKALEALPSVSEVQSLETFLPESQGEKIVLLRRLAPLLPGAARLQSPVDSVNVQGLNEILGRILFKMMDSDEVEWGDNKPLEAQMARVRGLIDQLRQRFRSMENSILLERLSGFESAFVGDLNDKLEILRTNANARPMKLDDLPKSILERFVAEDRLYLIRVFPVENIWEPPILGRFVRDLRSVDPDAIGAPVTLYTFTRAFRDACIKAAVYATFFIFALLLVTMRNLIHAFLVFIPLIVGTAWTVGLMHVFKVDFNLANTLFLPLIVGAGIEYGIIIMHRWLQQGAGGGDMALPFSTAKGIILAGLTTTVGFGSLAISDHQGIHSLGILAMIGSLSVLAAAVLFLPAILQLIGRVMPRREILGKPTVP
jgi:hopanoid biosynthesis associated RND transporter like protein HpnN